MICGVSKYRTLPIVEIRLLSVAIHKSPQCRNTGLPSVEIQKSPQNSNTELSLLLKYVYSVLKYISLPSVEIQKSPYY